MLATTPELSRRIEEAASEYLLQRYSGPGNPMGTQVLQRGRCSRPRCRSCRRTV